ncbi:hypothetical protein MBLNU230_g7453t1 [Neophaeotheca triangularis]
MDKNNISPPPLKRRRLGSEKQSQRSEASPQVRQAPLTLYSWNINGIGPFIQTSIASFFENKSTASLKAGETPKACLRDFLRRHGWPTMLFLQEVKIRPGDAASLRAIEKAIQRPQADADDEPAYVAHFCLPSDRHNAKGFGGKVYGVCSIIRKDFYDDCVTDVRPVEWDLEGRFLVIETRAALGMPRLAFINVYAVNGTTNPYKEPIDGTVVGTRHDRKLQVHKHLAAECRQLEAKGYGVILAGDMNIARKSIDGHPNLRTYPNQHSINRADFEARFFADATVAIDTLEGSADGVQDRIDNRGLAGLDMIDTFRFLHPIQKGYTYYPRTRKFGESCDRVDMILLSRSLEDALVAAGMHETPAERGPSDHVPLWAKLTFD